MEESKLSRFWVAVAALAAAGWLMNMAMWFCHFDPEGMASDLVPKGMSLGQIALHLRMGSDACLFCALTLLPTGFMDRDDAADE